MAPSVGQHRPPRRPARVAPRCAASRELRGDVTYYGRSRIHLTEEDIGARPRYVALMRWWTPAKVDGLLALALTVFAQLNLRFHLDQSTTYGPAFATGVTTAAATGVLALRRRAPLPTMVAVAAAHGVRNLRAFGSVARGEDRPDSDVDLLADFPPGLSLFGLGRVEADLEGILGTRVDLIPAADLKPDVRERVESDLIAL